MLTERPWRMEAVGLLVAGLLAALGVASSVGWALGVTDDDTFATMLISTLGFHVASLFLVHIFLRVHGVGWVEAFGFNAPSPGRAILLTVGVTSLALPSALMMGQVSWWVLSQWRVEAEPQAVVTAIRDVAEIGPRVYMAGMAVAVVPVSEELLFRGILYPALKVRVGRGWALWLSAAAFGLIHFNLIAFVSMTFLGLVLALLYEWTETLFSSILAHSLFNLANLFLLAFVPQPAWGLP